MRKEPPFPARSGPELEEAISQKKAKKNAKGRARTNGARSTPSRVRTAAKVRDYEAHVLVCGGSDCKKRGAKGVRQALKSGLRERSMIGGVRVDSVACLGLCKHGPNAVVYPGGTWYLGLREKDVPEIVAQHLQGGAPVEKLAAGVRRRKK